MFIPVPPDANVSTTSLTSSPVHITPSSDTFSEFSFAEITASTPNSGDVISTKPTVLHLLVPDSVTVTLYVPSDKLFTVGVITPPAFDDHL